MGIVDRYEQMNPGARILLYLTPPPGAVRPDIVPLGELTHEIYGIDSIRARARCLNMIIKLRRLGWGIGRTQQDWKGEYTSGYLLDRQQAALVWDVFIHQKKRWAAHIALTPKNVKQAGIIISRKS